MRRLFVPSVVLLVLSVVMMVWSWCSLHIVSPNGRLTGGLSFGNVTVFLIKEGVASNPRISISGPRSLRFPLRPEFTTNHKAIEGFNNPLRVNWLTGTYIQIPTWYFVLLTGLLTALLWLPWSRHRRRYRVGCCTACGYDLSGGQSVCPECGRAKAAAGASATPSQ